MSTRNTTAEQDWKRARVRFADVLFSGSWYSLIILLITFGIYLSGSVEHSMSPEATPAHWHMSAGDFNQLANTPNNWGWLKQMAYGGYWVFAPVAILLSLAPICLMLILPIVLKQKDWLFTTVLLLLLGTLCLAASGLL